MTMASKRSPCDGSHTSASTTILPYNTHFLPSPSSYIRTNSIQIQTDEGRKFDSGISKQQFHFNINDSSSTLSYAYSSPYYNYHHRRKNRSFLKPLLGALISTAILLYLLISEKLQLSSFSLAKSSSSSSDRIPKSKDATVNHPAESISSLDRDTIITDNTVGNIKNTTKIKNSTIGEDDENTMDVDDDELRGMEDDDTINNATSNEVIANEDIPEGGASNTIDYNMDTQFSFENNTMLSTSDFTNNTTATINTSNEPMS